MNTIKVPAIILRVILVHLPSKWSIRPEGDLGTYIFTFARAGLFRNIHIQSFPLIFLISVIVSDDFDGINGRSPPWSWLKSKSFLTYVEQADILEKTGQNTHPNLV